MFHAAMDTLRMTAVEGRSTVDFGVIFALVILLGLNIFFLMVLRCSVQKLTLVISFSIIND
jgi:hypothetical protein